MQCLPVAKLPEGANWEYEVKFDGYRALGIKSGSRVSLMSRNQNDLAARFPILAQALAELPNETIIDGELVALDETGRPSFSVLQNYHRASTPLQFYAFDVLTLAGRSLQNERLEERRRVLRTKVMPRMPESVVFSETLEATASEVTEAVKTQGLEGVIALPAHLLIRRVAYQVDGQMIVRCDNPKYPQEIYSRDLRGRPRPIGRVVWYASHI